jgi:hypothetical protein
MTIVQEITEDHEDRVRTAVSLAFRDVALGIDTDAVTDAISGDDENAWADALGIEDDRFPTLEASLSVDDGPYDAAITFLLLLGGGLTATSLGFTLGMFTPEIGHWSRLIVNQFAEATATNAATSVLDTIRRQRSGIASPDEITARALRAINLTPKQAASLDSFNAVMFDVLNAPVRLRVRVDDELRIPRALIERAIRTHGSHLNASQRSALRKLLAIDPTPEAIQAISDREASAMERFRLDTIARQESLRAVNTGQHAAFAQGVREGHIPQGARRFWVTAGDERVRHSHAVVRGLNADGVRMDQTFTTPFGPTMFPPLEINCRCQIAMRSETSTSAGA